MVIKNYSDLERVEDNMLVDLSNMEAQKFKMAINFLAGLTSKNGKLIKIAKDKFLFFLGDSLWK